MKRDMDLVRKILFLIEANEYETGIHDAFPPKIEGYTEQQILYHLLLMTQADLLHVDKTETPQLKDDLMTVQPKFYSSYYSLGWNGHEFLDAARDNKRWEKAKGTMNKVGGVVLPVLMQLLTSYMKAELKLP